MLPDAYHGKRDAYFKIKGLDKIFTWYNNGIPN
jgi:hypothetical protein